MIDHMTPLDFTTKHKLIETSGCPELFWQYAYMNLKRFNMLLFSKKKQKNVQTELVLSFEQTQANLWVKDKAKGIASWNVPGTYV